MLCLPVDVIIFYKEPIGMVGTMFAMVLGFVPFGIMIADAAFPETETVIITKGIEYIMMMMIKTNPNQKIDLLTYLPLISPQSVTSPSQTH